MTAEDASYELVLPFDSDDPAFARGFEAGKLWGRLQADPEALVATVHARSTEMVLRIGEALGRPVIGVPLSDDWTEVRFERATGDTDV